jgi:hypothetical protein
VQSILLDRGRREAGLQAKQRLTQQKDRIDACIAGINAAIELERRLAEDSLTVAPIDKATLDAARRARTILRTSATRLDAPGLSDDDTISVLGGKALEDSIQTAESIIDRAATRIRKALVDERNSALPADINAPIPDVPGQYGRRVRLDGCRQRLQSPIELTRGELTPHGVEQVIAARTKRREDVDFWQREHPMVLEALAKEEPEVQRFLLAAASDDGASLAQLTPAVKDRLVKDNLLDEFRIRRR